MGPAGQPRGGDRPRADRRHGRPQESAELYPAYPYERHAPIVQQGGLLGDVFDQDVEPAGSDLLRRPAPGRRRTVAALTGVRNVLASVPALLGSGDGIGSNSWVVDGEHTATGEPILANDPHLGISLPGVWSQIGLHCRTVSSECPMDVAGFSFSGVPGVVIGHNADIAWGFTNLSPDVTDLYVERVAGDTWQSGRLGAPDHPTRRTVIKVAGAADVTITVRATRHGPLMSDLIDNLDEAGDHAPVPQSEGPATPAQDDAVSIAWTALRPSNTADAILDINLAQNCDEFRDAARAFAVPSQNLVYADTDGHIGYQATPDSRGRSRPTRNTAGLPARSGLGRDLRMAGRRAVRRHAHRSAPCHGIIATANQAVIDPRRYPPRLTDDWDQGYRSTRINELLAADDELSVAQMGSIQLDDWSAIGEALTPYLLEVDLPSGYYSDGQRLLRSWNHRQGADSAAAAYFNVVWRQVLKRTFADELPASLEPDGSDRWFAVVSRILRRAGNTGGTTSGPTAWSRTVTTCCGRRWSRPATS